MFLCILISNPIHPCHSCCSHSNTSKSASSLPVVPKPYNTVGLTAVFHISLLSVYPTYSYGHILHPPARELQNSIWLYVIFSVLTQI